MTTRTRQEISADLKRNIERRARLAPGTQDVVDAVFSALIDADIDQWGMDVDDWKALLFEAFQTAKASRIGRNDQPLAA